MRIGRRLREVRLSNTPNEKGAPNPWWDLDVSLANTWDADGLWKKEEKEEKKSLGRTP